jgi:2-C-methyl-D-erythritol 4-phosphate cytidylyltransferase
MEPKVHISRVAVLIPSAGVGRRIGGSRAKQLLKIGGKPILIHTLEKFSSCVDVDEIILIVSAVGRDETEQLLESWPLPKRMRIVTGGEERTDSVRNGLDTLDASTEIVLIHDAVRPFVSTAKIEKVIQAVRQHGAALLAVPEKATVKRVQDGVVQATLDRSLLWQAQTPQGFRYDLIREAYEAALHDGVQATDDAALVERLGHPVHIIEGEEQNIKITTPVDLVMAEAFLENSKTQKTINNTQYTNKPQ